MNSPTITMEREAALTKLGEYEEAAKKNPKLRTELDKQVMQGYRILARGGRMVDVNEALRHGGLNLAGIPKLAIARAHVAEVMWRPGRRVEKHYRNKTWTLGHGAEKGTGVYVFAGRWSVNTGSYRVGDDRAFWSIPSGIFDREKIQVRDFTALTPLIPLPHRPRHDLSNYFLLWEANWNPAPPVDPYLLRPVAGSLMEIVAEWEVSPVELAAVRAAMR